MRKIGKEHHGVANHREDGFVLFTVLMLSLLVSTVAFASYTATLVHSQSNLRERNRMVAYQMAEAAIDKAIVEIKDSLSYAGTTGGDYTFNTGDLAGGYSITVSDVDGDSSLKLVQVTGFSPDNSSDSNSISQELSVYGNATEDFTLGSVGAFSRQALSIDSGSSVKSFDSSVTSITDPDTFNPTSDGALLIASNTSIEVDGSDLETDISLLSGGSFTLDLSDSTFTGTRTDYGGAGNYSAASTGEVSAGDLELNTSETVQLGTGTYHYDSLDLPNDSHIECLGTVTIYVSGSVMMDQGSSIRAFNNDPSKLKIYIIGSGAVELQNSSDILGSIYAPDADVTLNGSRIIGSVVSETLTVIGSELYLDSEATGDTDLLVEGTFDMLSWRSSAY